MNYILLILAAAVLVRLVTLKISITNEKAIQEQGGTEHGALNSKILAGAHFSYYIGSGVEAWLKNVHFNQYTGAGVVLFLFSMAMLAWVIVSLKNIWTVKIYILKNHTLNQNALFRFVRHPNYFLNVIPELVAIALICQSWNVLMFGLPLYLVVLGVRIVQEERAMKANFTEY